MFLGIAWDRSHFFGIRDLFAGDVGTNLMGLGDLVGFENSEEGRASHDNGEPIAANAELIGAIAQPAISNYAARGVPKLQPL